MNHVTPDDYAFPQGNRIVGDLKDIRFIDPAGGDYRLSPKSKVKPGIGFDVSKLPPDLLKNQQQ